MVAIFLALAASLTWGTTDFAGGMLTRRLPLAGVTIISQASGFMLLLVLLAFSRTVDGRSAWLGGIGGVALGIGLACFYAALARGTMSIVSPITACAAVVPVTLALAAGERPSTLALAGSGLALGGAILASFEEHTSVESGRSDAVGLAVAAALAFGVWIYFLGRGSHDGSALSTLLGARIGGLTVLLAWAIASRSGVRMAAGAASIVALVGLGDLAGSALFALATQHGLIAVVAILGSLFPVATVMLAHAVLRERISRVQQVGVAIALAGVAVVAAAG
jgi:drug/metabolite transporter (DMT)-like permease